MTTFDAHAHETVLLRRQLDAAERELDHRANVISKQADQYSRMRNVAIRRAERIEALEVEVRLWREAWTTRGGLSVNPRSTSFPSPEDE